MLLSRIIVLFIFSCCNFSAASAQELIYTPSPEKYFGDDDRAPSLQELYKQEFELISDYINSYQTLTANFKQSSKQDNTLSYGKIFIAKPGKIRFEYLSPSKLLIIFNDNKLTYYDQELNETSYAKSDINILKILAEDNFSLNNFDLVHAEKDEHYFLFAIKEHSKKLQQNLVLILKFSYPEIALKHIGIETEGNQVDLLLEKINYNEYLSKQIFFFNRLIKKKG